MLPYHLLEALVTTAETGHFGRAAAKLHITQSALSQRIATLEELVGERLMNRGEKVALTSSGTELVAHTRKVQALEEDLKLQRSRPVAPRTLSIAANSDSVATWFLGALASANKEGRFLIRLIIDNESETFARMRAGEVFACVSSSSKRLPGCELMHLGRMRYRCLASKPFIRRYFARGFSREACLEAPSVCFDDHDARMHRDFLRSVFGSSFKDFPHHVIPSTQGFFEMIKRGQAYGLVSTLECAADLKKGTVQDVSPRHHAAIDLYWHHVRAEAVWESSLREAFAAEARKILKDD